MPDDITANNGTTDAAPSPKQATFKTLPGTHSPGTAEVAKPEADDKPAEPGAPAAVPPPQERDMELVALVTRPMPDPVRSGTIFHAPATLARHYIAQGWAVESKPAAAPVTPESEPEK